MSKFEIPEYQKQRPMIHMAPLIDIVFLTLIFFMTISVLSQMESELNINVPNSSASVESLPNAGKIVIHISRDGKFIVNEKELNADALEEMLLKVSKLFPGQQVVIRADELSYHKHVIRALDACLHAKITDVSFATVKDEVR